MTFREITTPSSDAGAQPAGFEDHWKREKAEWLNRGIMLQKGTAEVFWKLGRAAGLAARQPLQLPELPKDAEARARMHGMNCPASVMGRDEECTCSLRLRIALQTEREMHGAWRKRAEESELREQRIVEICRLVPHDHSKTNYLGPATCVRCLIDKEVLHDTRPA